MVWEAVYADGRANLRFACKKPEVLWRLAKLKKPAEYRLFKTCFMFFWPSTDTPSKRRQSNL